MTTDPNDVRISNIVGTALFNCTIDLTKLAWAVNGDYDPAAFAAEQIRLLRPAATALVFHSGRLVTTGATSESAALSSIWIFFRKIKAFFPEAIIQRVEIQNIVASSYLGMNVRLDELAKKYALDAIFDSSLFPGLRLHLKTPSVTAFLFAKGRVVLTGAKDRTALQCAWAKVRKIAETFLTTDDVTHRSMQISRNAKRKLKVEELPEDAVYQDEGLKDIVNEPDVHGSVSVSQLMHIEPLCTVFAYFGSILLLVILNYQTTVPRFIHLLALFGALFLSIPLFLPIGSVNNDAYYAWCAITGAMLEVLFGLCVCVDVLTSPYLPPGGKIICRTTLLEIVCLILGFLLYNFASGQAHVYFLVVIQYVFVASLVVQAKTFQVFGNL